MMLLFHRASENHWNWMRLLLTGTVIYRHRSNARAVQAAAAWVGPGLEDGCSRVMASGKPALMASSLDSEMKDVAVPEHVPVP